MSARALWQWADRKRRLAVEPVARQWVAEWMSKLADMTDEDLVAVENTTESIEVDGLLVEFTRFNRKQADDLPREVGAIASVRSGLLWGNLAMRWTLAGDGFQLVNGERRRMEREAWE